MKVTNLRKWDGDSKTKAFFAIETDEGMVVKGFRLVQGQDGLFMSNPSEFSKKDDKYKTRGGFFTQPLMTTSMDDRPNLQYSIYYKGEEIKPRKQWVWSKERIEKAISENEVVFNKQKDGSYSVRSKQYMIDENGIVEHVIQKPKTKDHANEILQLLNLK